MGAGEVAEVNHLNGRGKAKRSEPNYESLLKNVKPHILDKILKIYYLDFILFGYSTAQFEADMQAMINFLATFYKTKHREHASSILKVLSHIRDP